MRQVVSLSGGKDSTAMLLMMLERGEQIGDIVFFDWGMEFPEMYDHLDRLEAYMQRPITRLYPKHSYEYYMFDHVKTRGPSAGKRGYGWPHWRRRWCTRIKLDAMKKWQGDATVCIGIAADEAGRRCRQWTQHITPMWGDEGVDSTRRFPLVEWNVDDGQALAYCKARGFDWGGLYRNVKRVSCWCCALRGARSLMALHDSHPELWERLLDMDERSPFTWPGRDLDRAQQFLAKREQELAALGMKA